MAPPIRTRPSFPLSLSHQETEISLLSFSIRGQFSSVQLLSHAWLFANPWTAVHPAPLPITNSRSLPKTMFIKSMMPSNHLILCCPLLLLPPIPPSIRVFSSESALRMRWPSIRVSASASVLPMNTQDLSPSGRTDWISLQSKGLSRVFPNTTVQKHQFFSVQLSSQSNSTSIHDHWKNHSLKQTDLCWQSNVSAF